MDFISPKIMGILNITPDSFYDGNKYMQEKAILKRVETMLDEGADIIDIGGFSSRPGAKFVSMDEEKSRILPNLELIFKNFPDIYVSLDTFRSEIAQLAANMGVKMINDISAGNLDDKMFKIIAKLQIPYIMMHMQGTPDNMQTNPYYKDVVNEILIFFFKKIEELKKQNFNNIIIDPGFGFGKTINHNFDILHRLDEFKVLKKPILVGISRKSMFYKMLKTNPEKSLNATTSGHTIALLKGANILRVHDVKEAKEVVSIVNSVCL